MADRDTEFRYVAKFCRLVLDQSDQADRYAAGIAPEMLEAPKLAVLYRVLAEAHARGEYVDGNGIDQVALEMYALRAVGAEEAGPVFDYAGTCGGADPKRDAAAVLHHWQARTAAELLGDLSAGCLELLKDDPKKALQHAEDGVLRAHQRLLETGVTQAPRTRGDIAAAELAIVTEPRRHVLRASWPYPKMRRALGDLLPGRMYGITAFPNAGKSTLAANLLYGFLRQGVPCIPVVTEMGDDWLRRAWAAEAGVPQDVAENRLWDADDPEVVRFLRERWATDEHGVLAGLETVRRDYVRVVERFPDMPCEVVEQSPLTPDQLIARLKILRRRFAGRFVVAIVDHFHNLKYPNDEVDRHVGVAAARVRDFCRADGAMACVALFQPKKPEKMAGAEYKPVYARDVRGQVAQVLDVHMSIYRRHVLTSFDTTPWGTRKAALDPASGNPRWCGKAEAEELGEDGEAKGKLDDERMYIKPDKRRIGGEGKTFILDFEADTGRVFERETRRHLQAV